MIQKTPSEVRFARSHLKEQNRRYGACLQEVAIPSGLADDGQQRTRALRSQFFLVQEFDEGNGVIRLSVNRTEINSDGGWKEGISWDELQQIKAECGYPEHMAVEIYPPAIDVVNVANIRHLWVLPEPLPFMWKSKRLAMAHFPADR